MDAAIAQYRLPVAIVLAASLLGGCTSDPASSPPSPPTIQAIGILADEHIADPNRTYILADGRTVAQRRLPVAPEGYPALDPCREPARLKADPRPQDVAPEAVK